MEDLDDNETQWSRDKIIELYKRVQKEKTNLETQFKASYNTSGQNKVPSKMQDLANNNLLNKDFVEGKTKKAPLMIEFDNLARSYLYDLYDHIEVHSKKDQVKAGQQDATQRIEQEN